MSRCVSPASKYVSPASKYVSPASKKEYREERRKIVRYKTAFQLSAKFSELATQTGLAFATGGLSLLVTVPAYAVALLGRNREFNHVSGFYCSRPGLDGSTQQCDKISLRLAKDPDKRIFSAFAQGLSLPVWQNLTRPLVYGAMTAVLPVDAMLNQINKNDNCIGGTNRFMNTVRDVAGKLGMIAPSFETSNTIRANSFLSANKPS